MVMSHCFACATVLDARQAKRERNRQPPVLQRMGICFDWEDANTKPQKIGCCWATSSLWIIPGRGHLGNMVDPPPPKKKQRPRSFLEAGWCSACSVRFFAWFVPLLITLGKSVPVGFHWPDGQGINYIRQAAKRRAPAPPAEPPPSTPDTRHTTSRSHTTSTITIQWLNVSWKSQRPGFASDSFLEQESYKNFKCFQNVAPPTWILSFWKLYFLMLFLENENYECILEVRCCIRYWEILLNENLKRHWL